MSEYTKPNLDLVPNPNFHPSPTKVVMIEGKLYKANRATRRKLKIKE